MKTNKKRGISLLVLIITIIVMIILASAVILSITSNNPISKANETKVKTDLTALKDEYNNFYSSALFDNVSNTKGYYTDKMNITKEGNIIYKGKVVNEGENNSLANIMPSIVGTEYEGKVFVADGKIYIDNRDQFLSEEQQEWAKEVGINVLNEGEVLVLSTEEVSLKISQKERIYATVMPDTDSQVEFDIDEKTKVRQLTSETNTVDIQGISDGVAILTAKVTAEDGTEIEKKVTIKVNVGDYIKVERITIDPNVVELGLDDEQQLKAIITPESADNQEVSWEVDSQNPKDAVELTETGLVTGRNVGTAKIIAKGEYGNLTSEECSVKVIDRTTITLDKTTLQLRKGQEGKLKATVENKNTRQGTLTWETSDDTKVGVDQEGNITAKEVGRATITAKYLTKSVTCQVEVLDPLVLTAKVTEARGTKATLNISANTTYNQIEKIEIKHRKQDTEEWITDPPIDVNKTEYSTDSYEISGLEPLKTFEIEVIATLKDGSCEKKVTLQAEPVWIPVESVTLNKGSTKIVLGETETLTATVLPEDASNKTVTWESGDQSKATVSEGVITTTGVGNTTITVKANDNQDKKATCQVEVTEPITIDASVDENGITSSSIPVKVKTSTEHGTLAKITIRYKKTSENNNWQEKEVIDGVSGQINYDDTIIIEGLKDETQYDIEVKVEISSKTSNYANGHSVTQSGLSGTTLKIPVNSVSLSPTSIKIPLGNTENIQATIQPSDATHQGLKWESGQTSIVTIEGEDTAKSGAASATIITKDIGTTNVKVTSTDNEKATAQCSVEVTEPISLTAQVVSGNITDEVIPVSINTLTKHGTIKKIEVMYKENGASEWITKQVNDLESNQTSYIGTFEITNLTPNTEYNIQVKVTLESSVIGEHSKSITNLLGKTKKRDVTGLVLNNKTLDIPLGDNTQRLIATITPNDATNQVVNWSSSDIGVATVNDGTITTKSLGKTIITATSQDNNQATDSCTVNVTEPITIEASIEETTSSTIPVKINTTTKVGTISSIQVKYRAKNTDTWTVKTVSDLGTNVKSYNKTYTINSGLNPYTEYEIEVVVTISTNHALSKTGLKATTKKINVTGISVNPTSNTIVKGNTDSFNITATITPQNATNKGVNWTTDNGNVATVNSSGTVTLKGGVGTAHITATSQDNSSASASCTVTVQEAVAQIGKTYYSSLQSAFDSVSSDCTISLLKDINSASSANYNKHYYTTLNMNGHNISVASTSSSNQYGYAIRVFDGTLEITGSQETIGALNSNSGSTMIVSNVNIVTSYASGIDSAGNLTIKDGTNIESKEYGINVVSGVLTIEDGTINSGWDGVFVQDGATANIYDGNISGVWVNSGGTATIGDISKTVSSSSPTITKLPDQENWGLVNYGTTYYNNGSISGGSSAIWSNATLKQREGYSILYNTSGGIQTATLGKSVTGLTLNPTSKTIVKGNTSSFSIAATISPSDAGNKGITWTTDNSGIATVSNGTVTLKGGVGTATITATSQDNANAKATCEVTVQDAVAQIGSTNYATLQSAFDAVTSNTTIKLLKDITLTSAAEYSKTNTVVLDMNGHNITQTGSGYAIRNMVKGNLEIKGSQNKITGPLNNNDSGTMTVNNIVVDNPNRKCNGCCRNSNNKEWM